MKSLRIAISPDVKAAGGPAIAWAWRQLFIALGWSWHEVGIDDPCDIAYVSHREQAARARVGILGSPERWGAPSRVRLARVELDHAPFVILFEGDGRAELIARDSAPLWLARDVIFDLFWLLTGQEEAQWPQDTHGFRTLPESWVGQHVLEQAPASALIEALGRLFTQMVPEGDPLPRWPLGKRAAAAITHDVDYPEVIRWLEPLRIIARQGRRGLAPAWQVLTGRRSHWSFPQWMEMEAGYGVRSAFYFVARQGSLVTYARGVPDPFYDIETPRFRSLFRMLADSGWEVGMHASYLAYTSHAQFAAEKARLEEAAGAPVLGNRHHYWHMNPTDPEETLQLHADIGLIYDTSLAHDRYLGWRRSMSIPYFPYSSRRGCEIGAVQLPVAWMDAQLMQRRELSQAERERLVCELVDRAAEQQGIFVADVHDYVYDQVLFPGWRATLQAAIERITTRGDFWVTTPAAIAQHWRERNRRIVQASIGLEGGQR